ncbi:MAG: IclR family transcriptional regulator [Azospirillum brasilense]|nr:MAG: IclR family transcriptional regulator [Azospirillum brasilense]
MTAVLDRSLRLLEQLALQAEGLPLHVLADRLQIPRSAAHRLLNELIREGYVRQEREGGPYSLTIRLVSLGLTYLARNGIPDVAQPILDGLARRSGELCRLGITDGTSLTWVAKAQGARDGLRYDPDDGAQAMLAPTANGQAWLASMSDEAALALVARQEIGNGGFGDPARMGPGAPRTVRALLEQLARARRQGYATMAEGSAPGTAAVATVIRQPESGAVIGTLSLAGPSVRMTEARLHALAPDLLAAAAEMGEASRASRLFALRPVRQADSAAA